MENSNTIFTVFSKMKLKIRYPQGKPRPSQGSIPHLRKKTFIFSMKAFLRADRDYSRTLDTVFDVFEWYKVN